MIEFLRLILHIMASFFKPRTKLVAEILVLRQQLNVLRRQVSKRPQLSNADRFLFVWLYRWFPSVLSAIAILRPETIIRWHRAGFQSYWRGRSRKPVGRPRISADLRNLIGAMSRANHLWGAPHIHGELLKLGFTIAQSTVARYMYRGWPPSQGWRTFLTNHVDGIASHFGPTSRVSVVAPVRLLSGRLRLATSPRSTGSPAVKKTIGIVFVAAFTARTEGVVGATITATWR